MARDGILGVNVLSPLNQLLNGQMNLPDLVALIVSLIVCITIHEFSHAAAATWLGDTLPGRQGRLTLSPLAHLDPLGSLLFIVGGFGWGKPVMYNPYALRAGPRSGPALVSLAGPASNILLAVALAAVVRLVELGLGPASALQDGSFAAAFLQLLAMIVLYNLFLAFFNLIPIAPLDGFTVLLGLLPPQMAYQYEQTRPYGILILFALLLVGGGVLGAVLYRPVFGVFRLLIGA
jgi:Zn-dependent protease